MEKKEYKRFRELLKQIIGNWTQQSVSDRTGISRVHINRLLNDETISKPSLNTIAKIYGTMNCRGVLLVDILEACEYSIVDNIDVCKGYISNVRSKLSVDEQAMFMIAEIRAWINAAYTRHEGIKYPIFKGNSPSDLVNMIQDAVSEPAIHLDVSTFFMGMERTTISGNVAINDRIVNGDVAVICTMDYTSVDYEDKNLDEDSVKIIQMPFVLTAYTTGSGQFILTDAYYGKGVYDVLFRKLNLPSAKCYASVVYKNIEPSQKNPFVGPPMLLDDESEELAEGTKTVTLPNVVMGIGFVFDKPIDDDEYAKDVFDFLKSKPDIVAKLIRTKYRPFASEEEAYEIYEDAIASVDSMRSMIKRLSETVRIYDANGNALLTDVMREIVMSCGYFNNDDKFLQNMIGKCFTYYDNNKERLHYTLKDDMKPVALMTHGIIDSVFHTITADEEMVVKIMLQGAVKGSSIEKYFSVRRVVAVMDFPLTVGMPVEYAPIVKMT